MTAEQLKSYKRSYVVPSDIESDPAGAFNDMRTLISALESALAERVDAERWRHYRTMEVHDALRLAHYTQDAADSFVDAARLANAVKTKG